MSDKLSLDKLVTYLRGFSPTAIRDNEREMILIAAATLEQLDSEVERWLSAYYIAVDQATRNGSALAELRAVRHSTQSEGVKGLDD